MIIELSEQKTAPAPAPGDEIAGLRAEIDEYYAQMRQFNSWDSLEVLRALSAISARASELRCQMMRVDSRRATAFRTKELDPLIEELDRQFKIHSRIQAVREMEFKLSGGGM